MKTLREHLDLAEDRINELVTTQGYIYLLDVRCIIADALQEYHEEVNEAVRNGNITYSDYGWSNE